MTANELQWVETMPGLLKLKGTIYSILFLDDLDGPRYRIYRGNTYDWEYTRLADAKQDISIRMGAVRKRYMPNTHSRSHVPPTPTNALLLPHNRPVRNMRVRQSLQRQRRK